jgi:hypothetical protein
MQKIGQKRGVVEKTMKLVLLRKMAVVRIWWLNYN